MKVFILTIFILFQLGCALPEQPTLSKEEKVLLDSIAKVKKAIVTREIYPGLLGRYYAPGDRGAYSLRIILPCDSLIALSDDRAKTFSRQLALELYSRILHRERKFNEIAFGYECDTSSSRYLTKYISINTDSLVSRRNKPH